MRVSGDITSKHHSHNMYPRRSMVAAAGVVVLGVLTSCGASTESAPAVSGSSGSGPEVVDELTGTLNYDGLRSDGLCQNGGERPCFAPIRKIPGFIPPE